MVRHKSNFSELWHKLPWKKFHRTLFRLQVRVFKAIRAGDNRRARNLQKLILKSRCARLLAIRQVTQLNPKVDEVTSLTFKQRLELEKVLNSQVNQWKHSKLREISIPKTDGTHSILKVGTIKDRAWQYLVKYAIEPAHEAKFHPRSYGFRRGRTAWDAQKFLFQNLNAQAKGIEKRILQLDLEKCFHRINHSTLMEKVIAPMSIKLGLWQSLKTGINPQFLGQGEGISPLLANITFDGIETIHQSLRYGNEMVFILDPSDAADQIIAQIEDFLGQIGLKIESNQIKLVSSTEGFDFLGWHFRVQSNGKFRSIPSADNFKTFRKKVKAIVNCSNYGASEKAKKLAPLIKGWRQYHQFCNLDGKFSLWHMNQRAWKVFNKEKNLNRHQVNDLIKKAFPKVKRQK
ncbi:Group II intron maturase-specific domain protein [Gloeothece citriformis PCC 7424]|uniref:Group II intron maturase-specific domain protein n=1 Tax=Gloeothece citriformis (strain PCC 7424) TaxID=65393 RepID=B7KKM8_GLOC7|nr:Group II intron maturase-specific domain protein [Gloeothece citriformis PCC 7424]